MYTHRRYTISVRDLPGRYGDGVVSPEDFPGAGALRDLTDAPESEVPLILARYAALRAWELGWHEAGGPVSTHALHAALEHLSATCGGWAERELLEEALNAGSPRESLRLLEAAADAAAALGHRHGARSLREAVHRARWRSSGFPPPSPS